MFHRNHNAFSLIKQYKKDKCHMWLVALHLDHPGSYHRYAAFTTCKHANSIQKYKAVTTCLSLRSTTDTHSINVTVYNSSSYVKPHSFLHTA